MRNEKDENKTPRVTRRSGMQVGGESRQSAPKPYAFEREDDGDRGYDTRPTRAQGAGASRHPQAGEPQRGEPSRYAREAESGEKKPPRTQQNDGAGSARDGKQNLPVKSRSNLPKSTRREDTPRRGGNPDRTVHQLFPYILFCLSIFAAVSFFLRDVIGISDGAGAFGSFLADFLGGLFGPISYAVPLFAFLLALRWRTYVRRSLLAKKLFLSASFVILLAAIFHVFRESAATRAMVDVGAAELYHNGVAHVGGGFFGGFVGEYLSYIFRLPGTIILAIPLLLIIGIYLIGMTPAGIVSRIACKWRVMREKRDARRAEMYDGVEERPRTKNEREPKPVHGTAVPQAQNTLAVNGWREPRPLEKRAPARERYTFSDVEDDPIPAPRTVREEPRPATPATELLVEDEEFPASLPIEEPVLPVAPQTVQAPASTAVPTSDESRSAPTYGVEESAQKQSRVYAPFALPIRPFPASEPSSQSVSVSHERAAVSEGKPEAVHSEAYADLAGAAPACPQSQSVQQSATSDDGRVSDGEEVLGSVGRIGAPSPTPAKAAPPVYTPARTENPAERYVHREAPFRYAPLGEPSPMSSESVKETIPLPQEMPEESDVSQYAPEEALGFAQAAPQGEAFIPEVQEASPVQEKEKEDHVPTAPSSSVFAPMMQAENTEPEAEEEIDEQDDEQEPSYRPAYGVSTRTVTFDREHIAPPATPPVPPVAQERSSVPVYTEHVEAPQSPTPQRVFAPQPVRASAPRAVPVKSEPITEELPAQEPMPLREYTKPTLDLLNEDKNVRTQDFYEEIEETKDILRQTMSSFNIRIQEEINYSHGPSVTRYEMRPVAGTSVRSVINRTEDISLNLASCVRIEAPIPGKPAIGIEVPNKVRETVYMRTMLESEQFKNSTDPLDVPLGLDVGGGVRMCNLAKMPHLLVAGTTGSGKSVCINSILVSLIYKTSPADLRLILIDPKQIEFAPYEHVPHLYMPIVTDMQRAAGALACAVQEMERRFSLIRDVGVRNIEGYNEAVKNDPEREHLPYIIIVIDEFADLKMSCNNNDPENFTCRIAQKARAAGMHLIIGTQRPSVDVITGKLKTNIPSRIAFMVKQQVDSRTILDVNGAEALTGRGDMLYMPTNTTDKQPVRIQGAFVSDGELERVISYVKRHNDPVQYNKAFMDQIEVEMARSAKNDRKGDDMDYGDEEEGGEDPKFVEAVELAVQSQKIATSLLQRRLGVGYGRAAKIIDRMEELGLVSPAEGNKSRKLLPAAQGYLDHLAGGESYSDEEYGDDFA